MKTGWIATAVATVVMLVAPASGAAATFCVHNKACVSDGGTLTIDLQAAFNDAGLNGPNLDRVEIGATALETGGHAASNNPVTVVGKGERKTTIGDPTVGARIVTLDSPESTISDLTITMDGTDVTGLTSAGDVSRVTITGNSDTPGEGILLFQGATARQLTISLASRLTDGVYIPNGSLGATVEDSRISADSPIVADGATNVIRRVAVDGRFTGISVGKDATTTTLDSVFVRVAATDPVAGASNPAVRINAPDNEGARATTTVRHLTALGTSNQTGVEVGTSCTSGTPNVTLRNSILWSFANSIVRTGASGCAPGLGRRRVLGLRPGDDQPERPRLADPGLRQHQRQPAVRQAVGGQLRPCRRIAGDRRRNARRPRRRRVDDRSRRQAPDHRRRRQRDRAS
jgi:hypothetical protein